MHFISRLNCSTLNDFSIDLITFRLLLALALGVRTNKLGISFHKLHFKWELTIFSRLRSGAFVAMSAGFEMSAFCSKALPFIRRERASNRC